jgi:hypothetical protein
MVDDYAFAAEMVLKTGDAVRQNDGGRESN